MRLSLWEANDYDMSDLWNADEDTRSLKSLILFGIRGISAYAYHAAVLGYKDKDVNQFFYKALSQSEWTGTWTNFFQSYWRLGKLI